jgi:hypothetical protein
LKGAWLTFLTAIASNYGEGASGKAVSTYFERAKKHPQWNLANTIAENGNGGGSAKKGTPRKRGTPAKSKKNAVLSNSEGDDEETIDYDVTPSKKPALNKVQSGRVQKSGGRAASKKVINYAESGDEDDDDLDLIKNEPEGFVDLPQRQDHSNGNANDYSSDGLSNGNRYNGILNPTQWSDGQDGGIEDDYFHDADEGDDA